MRKSIWTLFLITLLYLPNTSTQGLFSSLQGFGNGNQGGLGNILEGLGSRGNLLSGENSLGGLDSLLSTALGMKNPSLPGVGSELEKEIIQLLQNPTLVASTLEANKCLNGNSTGVCIPLVHYEICQLLSFQIIPNLCSKLDHICCHKATNVNVMHVLGNAINVLNMTEIPTSSTTPTTISTTTPISSTTVNISSTPFSTQSSTFKTTTISDDAMDYETLVDPFEPGAHFPEEAVLDSIEPGARSSEDLDAIDGREFPPCKMNRDKSGFCVPSSIGGLCQLFNLKINNHGCDDTVFDTCCYGDTSFLETQEILADDLNVDSLLKSVSSSQAHKHNKYKPNKMSNSRIKIDKDKSEQKDNPAILLHACQFDGQAGICLPKQLAELCPIVGMQINRTLCSRYDSCCYGTINVSALKHNQLVPFAQTYPPSTVSNRPSFISQTVNLCNEGSSHGFCVAKSFSEFCLYFGLSVNSSWCPGEDIEDCCYIKKRSNTSDIDMNANFTLVGQLRDNSYPININSSSLNKTNNNNNSTESSNTTISTNISDLNSFLKLGLNNISSNHLVSLSSSVAPQVQAFSQEGVSPAAVMQSEGISPAAVMQSQKSIFPSSTYQKVCLVNGNKGFCASAGITKICSAFKFEISNVGCSNPLESCCYSKNISKPICGKKGNGTLGSLTSFNFGNIPMVGEYCWQVALLDRVSGIYFCGGSLIGENWILTAAHCLSRRLSNSVTVRLGEWDLSSISEVPGHYDHIVSNIIMHEKFNNLTMENDIALLKLTTPANLTQSNICTICSPIFISGDDKYECLMSGFGQMLENGPISNVLKAIQVEVIDSSLCQAYLRNTTELGRNFNLPVPAFTCAMGITGPSVCFGDGGSPLACKVNGYYQLTGLVSWGIGCGRPNIPGVYVNVQNYNSWINTMIGSN